MNGILCLCIAALPPWGSCPGDCESLGLLSCVCQLAPHSLGHPTRLLSGGGNEEGGFKSGLDTWVGGLTEVRARVRLPAQAQVASSKAKGGLGRTFIASLGLLYQHHRWALKATELFQFWRWKSKSIVSVGPGCL